METARSRELEEKKKVQPESILNHLPSELRNEVISFLPGGDAKPKKFKEAAYSLASYDTLFFDMNVYANNATKATHNLLNRIKVEETLDFIKKNPYLLLIPVDVKDFHSQRFSGTLVQVLASAGEFNPVEMKADAKPYGLVHILQTYFTNPENFTSQLAERFKPGHELATQQRMARIKTAIETFIEDTIESKEISEKVPLETLLDLPIAKKFRESIKPDPNDVVVSGLGWDMEIFLAYIRLFKNKLNDLGGVLGGPKPDFVDAVVWPTLQRRSPLADLEVFEKGIIKGIEKGTRPDRFDFAEGGGRLDGIGTTHFFAFDGTKNQVGFGEYWGFNTSGVSQPHIVFRNYIQTKTSALHSVCGQEAKPRVTV